MQFIRHNVYVLKLSRILQKPNRRRAAGRSRRVRPSKGQDFKLLIWRQNGYNIAPEFASEWDRFTKRSSRKRRHISTHTLA